ncbi:hypothetical protein EG328_002630 [Venturia inaequalis]|uniref:Ubiquinol-cytochrome c chaperone domain-containing protein n=1 Tax=Venturia inaequalis TaxID=5025 RepID=A0A8H3YYD5_VENIN|nr:hypothetical protein EG328_002630 [Venturia inaequalis]
MASGYTCRTCLRALSSRTNSNISQSPIRSSKRAILSSRCFSVSVRQFAKAKTAVGKGTLTDDPKPADPLAQGDLLKDASPSVKLAATLRKRFKSTTETYVAYGITEELYKACGAQAEYKIVRDKDGMAPKTATGEEIGESDSWWYKGKLPIPPLHLGLSCAFNTWAQVTFLHMYILTVRIRLFPAEHAPTWQQHLIDHFSFAAEQKMEQQHAITSGSIRSRYLKDLFIQWRGILAAYDEGLVKGDAVMAAAVWRNIFKGAEDVDPVQLATVVSYLRREIARVGALPDDLIANGVVDFGNPSAENSAVVMKSKLMDAPFKDTKPAR